MRRALAATTVVAAAALAARLAIGGIQGEALQAGVAGTPVAADVPHASDDVLPVLQVIALDGTVVPPQAYRGRLLVLNVWAPWCAPCRREMPSLARLHARLDPARFQVAALAADEDRVAVAEYVGERALPFVTWTTPNRAESLARLGVDRIPTTLVVAPDGRVLARVVGPREWDAAPIVAELEAMAEQAERAGARALPSVACWRRRTVAASSSLPWASPAAVLRDFVRDLRSGAPRLRTRGAIVLLALAGYLAFMCALVVHQERAVQRTLAEAEAIGRAADALDVLAFDTAASASAPARGARADANLLAADATLMPSLRRDVAAAVERVERLGDGASDAERAHAAHGLRRVSALLHAEAGQHADSLRAQIRSDALVLVVTGFVGIAVLGFAILRYLDRLSAELTTVRQRAVDIVDGKVAPPATPLDEVGQLSVAIDQLATALAERRNELEIERRKRFHEEKMAAIGSLAAGVLTEIGNPIAAIDGFARAMKDGDVARPEDGRGDGEHRADAILEQTARLLVVARQIEEFTAPRPCSGSSWTSTASSRRRSASCATTSRCGRSVSSSRSTGNCPR